MTKHSETLGRDAVYMKKMRVSRLPGYLTIQMVRFQFKQRDAVNAKILKDIKFPLMLDVFDLCSNELQQKLIPIRSRFKVRFFPN
jgi:ubiquitin carboxyl-terminal hydrolase 14